MILAKWLRETSEAVRDKLESATANIWINLMRDWRLTDEQWNELQSTLVRRHTRGPLRFAEIEDAALDIVEHARLRRNSAQVISMFDQAKQDIGSGGESTQ